MGDIWQEGLNKMKKKQNEQRVEPTERVVTAAQAWQGAKNIGKGIGIGIGFIAKGVSVSARKVTGGIVTLNKNYKQAQTNRKFKKKGLEVY